MTGDFVAKWLLPSVLLLLFAGVVGTTLRASQAPQATGADQVPQWQFAMLKVPTETRESELGSKVLRMGRDGWELVSVENFSKDGTTTHTAFFFKRRLQE